MKRLLSMMSMLVIAVPALVYADYLPRSVGSPLGADVVVAVDTSASMTYDLCGDNQYNYCFGDGDQDERLAGQRTFCKIGDGRSRFQYVKSELHDAIKDMDSGKLALLHSGQTWDPSPVDCRGPNGRQNCTPASSYRFPPGPRGEMQLLHMRAPSRSVCEESSPSFGDRSFVSVDSKPIDESRPEVLRWLNGRDDQAAQPMDPELRGLGSSNAQGMLNLARRMHQRNAAAGARDQESCRRHFNIYLTDSVEWCSTPNNSRANVRRELTTARSTRAGADTIKTLVVGFGPEFRFGSNREILNGLARAGGLARDPETGNIDGFAGEALYARRPEELSTALNQAFGSLEQGEFQGGRSEVTTLWTTAAEIGRVRDNGMLVPTTELPGNRGHLYAFRLFHEEQDYSGEWSFRGEPSLRWDAGALLARRTSYPRGNPATVVNKPRRMYSALEVNPRGAIDGNFPGGSLRRVDLTWPVPQEDRLLWYRNTQLKCQGGESATALCRRVPDINRSGHAAGDDFDRRLALGRMVMRIRGALVNPQAAEATVGDEIVDESRGYIDGVNQWKLGPLVHSSPVTAELGMDQNLLESNASYKEYADAVRESPPMIYVPAGHLVHAFFTNDSEIDGYKLENEDHEAGEEAWAYLPRAVQPRLRAAFTGDFSDLRHDQLSMVDNRCRLIEAQLDLDHARRRGGWSAVLLCALGSGGRHLVALDVADPAGPVPLWEFTDSGMGETWSLPVVGRIQDDRNGVRSVAVFASGIDSVAGTGNSRRCSERWCNDRVTVYVLDLADGSIIARRQPQLPQTQGVMADASGLDHDGDGYLDFVYFGTTAGKMLTLHFTSRGPRLMLRRGTYNDALPMTGAPVIDIAALDAPSLDLILTSADVKEIGATGRKGVLRVHTDRRAGVASNGTLSRGCDLLRARAAGGGQRMGTSEHPVGRPIVAERTAFFTTVEGGATCGGATQRMRCVNLDRCEVTCNVVLCDPTQETCGAEPPPPSYLADGRLYSYSTDSGRLNAVVRVTADGETQEAENGRFSRLPGEAGGPNMSGLNPNQNQPKNLMLHWREVY
ncbi:MAG: PilC/PilY family type IV pilus protein [Myxococcota bacterium]|nr:PilC/PilY family type IV pilus protein [Myxococcota bacterium]